MRLAVVSCGIRNVKCPLPAALVKTCRTIQPCAICTQVMRRLRGSLNVAQLKGAYEDATDVHIVMEWCKGGELWHRIGRAHYSERTVRSDFT